MKKSFLGLLLLLSLLSSCTDDKKDKEMRKKMDGDVDVVDVYDYDMTQTPTGYYSEDLGAVPGYYYEKEESLTFTSPGPKKESLTSPGPPVFK